MRYINFIADVKCDSCLYDDVVDVVDQTLGVLRKSMDGIYSLRACIHRQSYFLRFI